SGQRLRCALREPGTTSSSRGAPVAVPGSRNSHLRCRWVGFRGWVLGETRWTIGWGESFEVLWAVAGDDGGGNGACGCRARETQEGAEFAEVPARAHAPDDFFGAVGPFAHEGDLASVDDV